MAKALGWAVRHGQVSFLHIKGGRLYLVGRDGGPSVALGRKFHYTEG